MSAGDDAPVKQEQKNETKDIDTFRPVKNQPVIFPSVKIDQLKYIDPPTAKIER